MASKVSDEDAPASTVPQFITAGSRNSKLLLLNSAVWADFQYNAGVGGAAATATCRWCDKTMCAGGRNGTSHLHRHIKKSCLARSEERRREPEPSTGEQQELEEPSFYFVDGLNVPQLFDELDAKGLVHIDQATHFQPNLPQAANSSSRWFFQKTRERAAKGNSGNSELGWGPPVSDSGELSSSPIGRHGRCRAAWPPPTGQPPPGRNGADLIFSPRGRSLLLLCSFLSPVQNTHPSRSRPPPTPLPPFPPRQPLRRPADRPSSSAGSSSFSPRALPSSRAPSSPDFEVSSPTPAATSPAPPPSPFVSPSAADRRHCRASVSGNDAANLEAEIATEETAAEANHLVYANVSSNQGLPLAGFCDCCGKVVWDGEPPDQRG